MNYSRKKDHNLKIATIFSYGTNEDDKGADGMYDSMKLEVSEMK